MAVALQSSSIGDEAAEAVSLGADTAYKVESPALAGPQIDAHLAAFEQVCGHVEPSIVLVGRTPLGRDVGPRLAFRLGAAVAQDCVEVTIDPGTGRVSATRPVYGGNAMAKVSFAGDGTQVVVVRPKTFEPLEADATRSGEVTEFHVDIDESEIKVRLVETVTQESEGFGSKTPASWSAAGAVLAVQSRSRHFRRSASFWAARWERQGPHATLDG